MSSGGRTLESLKFQKERETPNEMKNIEDIIAKTFPELWDADIQIQEIERLHIKRPQSRNSTTYPNQNIIYHR